MKASDNGERPDLSDSCCFSHTSFRAYGQKNSKLPVLRLIALQAQHLLSTVLLRLFERRIPSRPAAIGLRKQAGYMTAHLTRYVQPRALAFSGASIHDNTVF
jgi:hypothetical protein